MSSPSPASSPPSTNSTTAPPPSTTVVAPPTPSPPSTTPTVVVIPPPPPTTVTPPPSTTPSAPPPSIAPPPPSPPPPSSTPPLPSPSTTTPPPPSPPSPPGTTPSPPPPTTPQTPTSPSHKTPSQDSNTTTPSGGGGGGGNNGGGGGGVSTGVIVGIAIAGIIVLVVTSVICVCLARRKRRRRRDDYGGGGGGGGGGYSVPPLPPSSHPGPPKDGHYGVQGQHWQQNYPPPAQHYQIPKPPPGGVPPRPPPRPLSPQPPPPPPPPFMSSGGGSGSSVGSENLFPPPSPGISLGFSKSAFSYDELAMATNNFSEENILGQGGFGYVHKGVLPNGKEVAVKSLKAGSGQGEREFQAEVEIISRVHHKHLVTLVGYCITGSHRLLVYEFVPNRTMEFHLHGKGSPTMDWPTRLKIALGSAKGLAYLHEDCHPKIIHRDIKAANILLNDKFEAMVADFGLAKFTSEANTHVSTRVMGTFGYLAPEYAASGKLTEKSDVFSFGVMLLELITGHRPVDPAYTDMDDSLVDWARPLLSRSLEENNFESLVDPRLQNNYNPNEMARMVACAAACVRHSARRRPQMSKVVRALEGEVSLSDLNEGIRPGHSSMYNSQGSSDYDTGQYKEDMKKFRKMALGSQEYGSSEYGGTTSEYGVNQSSSSTDGPSRQTTQEMEMGKLKSGS